MSRFRGLVQAVACLALLSLVPARATWSQRGGAKKSAPVPKGVLSLDAWMVTRFRDVQLLPDSAGVVRTIVSEVPSPRIETAVDAPTGDTVYAIHFADRRDMSSLRVGTRVRLAAPSGPITNISADIVARRPFRAPRVPGADTLSAGGWRFGWAYLAIVRRPYATTAASMYRGWLLLDATDPSTKP